MEELDEPRDSKEGQAKGHESGIGGPKGYILEKPQKRELAILKKRVKILEEKFISHSKNKKFNYEDFYKEEIIFSNCKPLEALR